MTREIDEDPASEDIDRLDRPTIECPHCGAEIWDEAPACPACGTWIEIGARTGGKQAWIAIVAIIVLVAFLLAVLL